MKSTRTFTGAAALAGCSTALFLTLLAAASPAGADPVDPAAPPAPVAPVDPGPAPDPGQGPSATTIQAADTNAVPIPPNGVPHLASPDALPPGSTMDPSVKGDDSPNVGFLRDLWQAVQNHEISGKEALVMGLAQRGMDTPYPNQAPGPNVPLTPGNPVLPAPAAAPAPAPAPAPATP
jgi:hypothetical protein